MAHLALKIGALAIALGVVAFVVQASRSRARFSASVLPCGSKQPIA